MKMVKNLPTLKNRCYKKGMTTSIMIHSGLSRFKLRDAGTTRVS
jgi:ribosomal protein S14